MKPGKQIKLRHLKHTSIDPLIGGTPRDQVNTHLWARVNRLGSPLRIAIRQQFREASL